jgi:hypothetical protein
MQTMTITKENFWQKIWLIYKKVNSTGKVRITFESNNSEEYTPENHNAYLQAKKELKKWEALDISDLKAKYL